MYLLDIKSSLSLTSQHNNREIVFHQVEFVDKNILEARNPRRDTCILTAGAGLAETRLDSSSLVNKQVAVKATL